jgi:23S rRNA (uracil1939-C5)-methyltransferase
MTHTVPVALHEQYDMEAIRLNDDGDAVGQIHGFTVFIPELLPGEEATVEIVRIDKRFARGRIVQRLKDATERANPECAVFGACGGCQLQHLSYAAQLRHKQHVVENALRRIGGLEGVTVQPTLGMASPWRYRNQVQVPVRFDGQGGVRMGFFQPRSHEVVETKVCALEPEPMERMVGIAAHTIADTLGKVAPRIHHLIVRQSFATKQSMITLVATETVPNAEGLANQLVLATGADSICLTIQPRIGGPVWGPRVEVLYGSGTITEHLCDFDFDISPRSFFQVNTQQAEVLVRTAVELSDVGPDDVVLDAYCGTGTLALSFARRAKRVVGVEVVADAVRDAKHNATCNGISNTTFHVGKVEEVVPRWVDGAGAHFDVAVLDPPRKGCEPSVLHALAKAKPGRIVYVSCNPVTLARDLRTLIAEDYRIAAVQPVDMFPNTSHVECVVSTHRVDK